MQIVVGSAFCSPSVNFLCSSTHLLLSVLMRLQFAHLESASIVFPSRATSILILSLLDILNKSVFRIANIIKCVKIENFV